MDALELAMKMERDGEIFYRDLAAAATNAGFREIFNQLADDEIKHYQVFLSMRQQPEQFRETTIINKADNIFKQIIAENSLDNLDHSQLKLYQKAMELEKKSQVFYLEQAATADELQKKLWQKIAAEEGQHYFLLHNIYELVLRPEVWVENGEFVHLEEY